MTSTENLYTELKPEISAIADQLFDLSEKFLRKSGNFLPHAAVLSEDGRVALVAATPGGGSDFTNSLEVLPLLHEGLRVRAKESSTKALGVAENVTITLQGQKPTNAIKVLFEHRRGLNVALYLPFEKKLFKGYVFGATFVKQAEPEVNAWV